MKRYFEFVSGTSSKFWEIESSNATHNVQTRFGKIGTPGRIVEKKFDSSMEGENFIEKQIELKEKKGYIETHLKTQTKPTKPQIKQTKPTKPQKSLKKNSVKNSLIKKKK